MPKHEKSRRISKFGRRDFARVSQRYRLHASDNRGAIEHFYISLNTPVALSCLMLYRAGEYDQLVSKEVHPSQYLDGEAFRDDFAAISFLRKNSSLQTTFDRRAVALEAFKEAENQCKVVNGRLKNPVSSEFLKPEDVAVLHALPRKIDKILGSFDIDRVLDMSSWGPGSTLSINGSGVSSSHKFDLECDITRDAYDLFGPVMKAAYPLWENLHKPQFQVGNKIVTVPKNAKTDRTIAIEPGLNTWIQLGIGRAVRRRLRLAGYNLDSDLKNQRGAYVGSIDGSLATVDFKAASDTISVELVKFLLPPLWFEVLDAARSHFYTLDKVIHRSEKFSTMGNGFTFELESLIFLVVALAICQENDVDDSHVSIFGDDLVLPVECIPQLTRICSHLGFTINNQKSFSTGSFRESCGSYYFAGLDVKPIFLKKDLTSVKDIFRLANSVRLLAHRRCNYNGCDDRFVHTWHHIVRLCPEELRFKGPISAGDATISVNITEVEARRHPDGWEGFIFPGLPTVAVTLERESSGLLLAKLHSMSRNPFRSGDRLEGNNVSLRAKTKTIFKKRMFVSLWYDLGCWIPASVAG